MSTSLDPRAGPEQAIFSSLQDGVTKKNIWRNTTMKHKELLLAAE